MFKIVSKQALTNDVKRLDVTAPQIAKKFQAGHFVIVGPTKHDETVPLTVTEADRNRGCISLIFQETNSLTKKLGALHINDEISYISGPFGTPLTIKSYKSVVCIGEGIGIAQILPIIRAFKKAGAKVFGVIGAPTKRELMLEPQLRISCTKLLMSTRDGTSERRGDVTNALKELLDSQKNDLVYVAAETETLETVCGMTKDKGIKTLIHFNPLFCCGTNTCGACRLKVGAQTILTCEEGPSLDGHKVDFENLKLRQDAFSQPAVMDKILSGVQKTSSNLPKILSAVIKK